MTNETPGETGGETRWLDAQEELAWRAYLRGAALITEALDRDLQAHGVSLSEYEILALLSESTGRRQRMSVLADAVMLSRSRLTHTATRLERRGWVRREQSLHDRRGVELCLTAEGHDVLVGVAPVHVEGVRRTLVDPLGRSAFLQLGATMARVAATDRTNLSGPERAGPVEQPPSRRG